MMDDQSPSAEKINEGEKSNLTIHFYDFTMLMKVKINVTKNVLQFVYCRFVTCLQSRRICKLNYTLNKK